MIEIPDYKYAGVYAIKNTDNGKLYIGSSIRVKERLTNHVCLLKNSKHSNITFQTDYNNGHNFDIKILFKDGKTRDAVPIRRIEHVFTEAVKDKCYCETTSHQYCINNYGNMENHLLDFFSEDDLLEISDFLECNIEFNYNRIMPIKISIDKAFNLFKTKYFGCSTLFYPGKELNTLCGALNCQPEDIIEFNIDDKQKIVLDMNDIRENK